MGQGRFKDGKFDLVVVANFVMSDADWVEWERGFRKASEIFYNASEGQMQFGRIYVCDDNVGLDTAEVVLHDSGDPSYGTWGEFGTLGAALHLMPYVKRQVLTIHHEMGHHVWALAEEYAAPSFSDEIDKTNPAPDRRTIPIVDSGRADNELANQNAKAILKFGDLLERRAITADTATALTVDADFSDLPTESDYDNVYYQVDAECADDPAANFCIMERSRSAAGEFDEAGNWVDAVNPVTEFCAPSNHDPDGDTAQEGEWGISCWERILERAEFSDLVMPDPAVAGPTVGFSEMEWIVLDKQPRFALVLDRSGSMSSGHKMADAQYGAVYWLEFCALGDDQLAVIWYDHAIDRILNLVEIQTLPSLEPTITAINALGPRGSTNIRDGLFEALDQIQSLPTRAAVQVAILLTDGIHNTPSGSSALEALPDFQEGGVRIYALGVGAPDRVDIEVLDDLAGQTGGRSFAVGDDQPGEIETKLVEINAEVRGGIITTAPALFPDSKAEELDKVTGEAGDSKHKRPTLKEIAAILKIKSPKDLVRGTRHKNRIVAIPVDVEKGCRRASFTLVHPRAEELWLYLVAPNGSAVDMHGPDVHLVQSNAPHEFAVVDRPASGRWWMIAVRPHAGASFGFQAVAGGENPQLQVFGDATKHVESGDSVRIWASARWRHALSGLSVTATIVDPSGARTNIRLSDSHGIEDSSGLYEGVFRPQRSGRHQAIILIRNTGNSLTARPLHQLLHSGEKTLKLPKGAPEFVRRIVVSFDVGPRPKLVDDEANKGLHRKYAPLRKRPTPLRSAREKKKPAPAPAEAPRRKRK
jgi:hypothetical protein